MDAAKGKDDPVVPKWAFFSFSSHLGKFLPIGWMSIRPRESRLRSLVALQGLPPRHG